MNQCRTAAKGLFSRWNLPLAWLFFYRPSQIFVIRPTPYDPETKTIYHPYVSLVAERTAALETFSRYRPILDELLREYPQGKIFTDDLLASVARWQGKYLVFNRTESLDIDCNRCRAVSG